MEIGTIFTLDQYAEAYAYAVANNCIIEEIEPEGSTRRYQIVAIPEPTEYEKAQARIAELKALLDSKDYWTSKRADGEYSEEEWAEKVAIRKAWRAEINELELVVDNTQENI